jgi:hypothetical protein
MRAIYMWHSPFEMAFGSSRGYYVRYGVLGLSAESATEGSKTLPVGIN